LGLRGCLISFPIILAFCEKPESASVTDIVVLLGGTGFLQGILE
jgi:hypothetical protein